MTCGYGRGYGRGYGVKSILVYRTETPDTPDTPDTPVRKQIVCEHGRGAGQVCYPCEGRSDSE